MNTEEQHALLGLLGAVYGETKKMDQMIIGESKDLKRSSENIKETFTNVLYSRPQPQPEQPVAIPPVVSQQIPQQQLYPPPAPVQQQVLSLHPAIGEIGVEINKKLDTIILLLEQSIQKKPRKNVPKPSKNIIETISKLSIENKPSKHTESFI